MGPQDGTLWQLCQTDGLPQHEIQHGLIWNNAIDETRRLRLIGGQRVAPKKNFGCPLMNDERESTKRQVLECCRRSNGSY